MNPDEERLVRLEQKIDALYASSEKVRKYLLTTLIISVVTIVLPLLIALIALPILINTMSGLYSI